MTDAERFWTKVRRGDGCWEWTGSRNRPGRYGRVLWRGKRLLAHRVAWTVAGGEVPDGLRVLHRCDNPICVRPEHLFLGTQADNVADMIAKGRAKNQRGHRNGRAILTDDDVVDIRTLYHIGDLTQVQLGAAFGVSRPTICDVLSRRHWAHLP